MIDYFMSNNLSIAITKDALSNLKDSKELHKQLKNYIFKQITKDISIPLQIVENFAGSNSISVKPKSTFKYVYLKAPCDCYVYQDGTKTAFLFTHDNNKCSYFMTINAKPIDYNNFINNKYKDNPAIKKLAKFQKAQTLLTSLSFYKVKANQVLYAVENKSYTMNIKYFGHYDPIIGQAKTLFELIEESELPKAGEAFLPISNYDTRVNKINSFESTIDKITVKVPIYDVLSPIISKKKTKKSYETTPKESRQALEEVFENTRKETEKANDKLDTQETQNEITTTTENVTSTMKSVIEKLLSLLHPFFPYAIPIGAIMIAVYIVSNVFGFGKKK